MNLNQPSQGHRQYHDNLRSIAGGEWFDFEGLVRDIYSSVIKPGDFALDIGVNEGVHFHQIRALVGGNGLVVGVEAIPELARTVERRLQPQRRFDRIKQRLKLVKPNYRLYNIAVSNYDGTASFSWVKGSTGLSSLAKRDVAEAYQPEQITVPVTTIDALVGGIQRPIAFTKIDIEGAEFHAMQKGTKIFHDRSPIVFEFDGQTPDYFHYNADDLVSFIYGYGYKIYDFFGNEFSKGSELLSSGVWNYYAAPEDKMSGAKVRAIVSDSLNKQNISLPPLAGC